MIQNPNYGAESDRFALSLRVANRYPEEVTCCHPTPDGSTCGRFDEVPTAEADGWQFDLDGATCPDCLAGRFVWICGCQHGDGEDPRTEAEVEAEGWETAPVIRCPECAWNAR
jgi:hypothetical protein